MLTAADPKQAAAVVAAVEQFLADTAPAPAPVESANPWQRAALLDGVGSKAAFGPDGYSAFERRAGWQ